MGILSSLLSCLGCSSTGTSTGHGHAAQQQNASRSAPKATAAPRTSVQAPSISHSAQNTAQTAAQVATTRQSLPPSPSRRSSRTRVDLPLEYVQDPADNPEDSIILGRKASYSLGETQPSSRATSRANSSSNLLALANEEDTSHHTLFNEHSGDDDVRLLGRVRHSLKGRKCLVLDLDETLVHSSFKYMPDADFIIPVEIDDRIHNVYVAKRPGVDEFLTAVGALFEVVVFTASVAKYGDPLLDHLDVHHVVHHRLFRESCYNYNGNYIKNLSQLGRPLKDVIIIDNSPASYALQPQNAVPVSSWFSDVHDNELLAMLPFLTALAKPTVYDVSRVLDTFIGGDNDDDNENDHHDDDHINTHAKS